MLNLNQAGLSADVGDFRGAVLQREMDRLINIAQGQVEAGGKSRIENIADAGLIHSLLIRQDAAAINLVAVKGGHAVVA